MNTCLPFLACFALSALVAFVGVWLGHKITASAYECDDGDDDDGRWPRAITLYPVTPPPGFSRPMPQSQHKPRPAAPSPSNPMPMPVGGPHGGRN